MNSYKCHICGKQFIKRKHLLDHLVSSENLSKRRAKEIVDEKIIDKKPKPLIMEDMAEYKIKKRK